MKQTFLSVVVDTGFAIFLIACIRAVQFADTWLLGPGAELMGIPMDRFFAVGHLAVMVMWMVRCILTTIDGVLDGYRSLVAKFK